MRTGIIYGYTNLETGKMYIGQTIDPKRRYKQHLNAKYTNGWHIDYQKNPDKYEYSIIEYDIPEDKLAEREIFWISFFDSYNNGYNLTPGGLHSGVNHGDKITEETRRKMSNSHKAIPREKHAMYGKHHSEESKLKMSIAKKGKKISDEHRDKIRKFQTGQKRSKATCKKLSDNQIGRHWYNNGINNVFRYECPEGFVPGLLKNKKDKEQQ